MSDRKQTPNFRRRNFATSMSLQSTGEEEEPLHTAEGHSDYPLFTADRFQAVALRMQSSFDLPIGDTSSRELLQEDELIMATTRMMSVDEPDEEEEALDNFEMETPNDSRNDLEILSPIKLSMLSTQLLSTKPQAGSPPGAAGNSVLLSSSLKGVGQKRASESASDKGRARKVVEFANFDDNDPNCGKQKRTDSAGGGTDAAIQAKIFAEIKK